MSQRWPVALVQFQVSPGPQVNRQRVRHWLERAMAPGPTSRSPALLMLPEVWNSPYQATRFAEFAEPIPEPGADLLAHRAQQPRHHRHPLAAGAAAHAPQHHL